jgi:hypothetical protein
MIWIVADPEACAAVKAAPAALGSLKAVPFTDINMSPATSPGAAALPIR